MNSLHNIFIAQHAKAQVPKIPIRTGNSLRSNHNQNTFMCDAFGHAVNFGSCCMFYWNHLVFSLFQNSLNIFTMHIKTNEN